jgi:hypothetical protein
VSARLLTAADRRLGAPLAGNALSSPSDGVLHRGRSNSAVRTGGAAASHDQQEPDTCSRQLQQQLARRLSVSHGNQDAQVLHARQSHTTEV